MNDAQKPIVIFDTGIVLQAAINPNGPAADALELLDKERVTAYICPRLRSEMEDVLFRPVIHAKNPQITDEQIEAGLDRFDALAVMVPNATSHIFYPRDPDDEHVLNLAIEVGADYIISRDKDLLDLMQDTEFRRHHPGLSILDPVSFVTIMKKA